MHKEVLEYIIKNGGSMPLNKLAERVGYSQKRVRNVLNYHNVKRFRIYKKETLEKASETRTRVSEIHSEKMNQYNKTPWPEPVTTMHEAMRGKSYGGNTSLPGTKNPVNRSAVYSVNVGTFKSSMGW